MYKKEKLVENKFTWPICKDLLFLVLEDRVSDVFVCELVWERLFYTKEPVSYTHLTLPTKASV